MKRIVILAFVIVASVATYFSVLNSRSRQAIDTSKTSEEFTLFARRPPLTTVGSMYLIYIGHIDGEADFVIKSNQGRNYRSIKLKAGNISGIYGGAEEWTRDIHVSYIPKSVKSGKIYAVVYCGNMMTSEDREMYERLSRNPPTQTEQDAAANP
jgi:hypothetical protein